MLVSGKKTVLRPIKVQDLLTIQRWDNDPEVIRLVGKKFIGPGHTLQWFKEVEKRKARIAMAIVTMDGKLIGSIELEDISWRAKSAELRVCIGERNYWGKGYGSDAIEAFLRFVFNTLSIDYIYLRVYRSNLRAVRCYKKCGFKVEGLLRAGVRSANGHEDLVLMGYRRKNTGATRALD